MADWLHSLPKGYASFLHGNVVDMLHFPIIKPIFLPGTGWGGGVCFFSPIFNIAADASITSGVITILFPEAIFPKHREAEQRRTPR